MFNRHRFFEAHHHGHKRWFQKGDLKYVILDLVKDKPRYGYEIIRALEERSHGFYAPSPGTVYPTLQMLEEMGYVNSEQRDDKKVYTITEEGLNFLNKQEDLAEEIQSQMRDWWNPKDMHEIKETMREFGRLGQLVARQARKANSAKMQRIKEVISRSYNEIEDILKE
jgi:DNA-binding PadR family transcriptional regulator